MAFFLPQADGSLRCALKIIPGSSKTQVQGMRGEELVIKVAAAPERGKANQALISFLAKACALPKSSILIISGEHSQHKVLSLPGQALDYLRGFES